MKSLNIMTNTEKGRLLADLFPEQIAEMMNAMLCAFQYLRDNEAKVKREWGNGFITAELWYSIATDVEKTLQRHSHSMKNNSRVFSDQLFYGDAALFTIDCIVKFAEQKHEHPKFQKLVSVLFE